MVLLFMAGVTFAQKSKETPYEKFNRLYVDGVYHYLTGEYEISENELHQCLQINDSIGAVYYYLALNRLAGDDKQTAGEFLETACRKQPAMAGKFRKAYAAEMQRMAGEQRMRERASTRVEQPGKKHPDNLPDKDTFMKDVSRMTPEQIWEKGSKLVERFPFDTRLILVTARAGIKSGHWNESAAMLENGIDFASTDKDLYRQYLTLLINIYQHTGNGAKAQHYRKLLEKL